MANPLVEQRGQRLRMVMDRQTAFVEADVARLVQRLVQQRVRVSDAGLASPGLGLGSELTVRLPRAFAPGAPSAPHADGTPPAITTQEGAGEQRVLVVDDDADAAEMLAEALTALGFQVTTAHDGPTALDVAKRFEPHVVFLDIGLPVMNGYEVAQAMRSDLAIAQARLIALTGYSQASDREKTRAAGFDEHLVKPIDIAVLPALLSSRGAR